MTVSFRSKVISQSSSFKIFSAKALALSFLNLHHLILHSSSVFFTFGLCLEANIYDKEFVLDSYTLSWENALMGEPYSLDNYYIYHPCHK